MTTILKAENIFKKFFIKSKHHTSANIKDLFCDITNRPRYKGLRSGEFYALDNVSFNLNAGDSLGLIGTNGSGKSTLLRVIAGIIKADSGLISTNASIQSLINLGAGFNPELTGRQNIYTSAALFGLNTTETKKIFDSIEDFADLGHFIDNQIRTYSTGMYARLGFSVAVNLKPELLLIDEVLAVGDYNFQNKCRMKLQSLKKTGMTFILVSHSNTHIMQLCDTSLWLSKGKLKQFGPTNEVLNNYMEYNFKSAGTNTSAENDIYGPTYQTDQKKITSPHVTLNGEKEGVEILSGSELTIEYDFKIIEQIQDLNITFGIYRLDGLLICAISTLNEVNFFDKFSSGHIKAKIKIPNLQLSPGEYVVMMPIQEGQSYISRVMIGKIRVKPTKNLNPGILSLDYAYLRNS